MAIYDTSEILVSGEAVRSLWNIGVGAGSIGSRGATGAAVCAMERYAYIGWAHLRMGQREV